MFKTKLKTISTVSPLLKISSVSTAAVLSIPVSAEVPAAIKTAIDTAQTDGIETVGLGVIAAVSIAAVVAGVSMLLYFLKGKAG